jgi:hypothetical protein
VLRREQLGRFLQPRAHLLRDGSKTDLRKVVDGETRVARVVHRKHARKRRLQVRELEALDQLLESNLLLDLVEEDLDEDTR